MRLVTLVLALLAVTPAAAAPLAAQASAGSEAALRRAVVAARVRLDSLLAAHDTARLAAILAEDALLIRGADTIRGRAAVAAFVGAGLAGVPEVRLSYAPERMVRCAGFALDEREGDYVLLLSTYTHTDTLRGRYTARWVVGGDGAALLSVLALARRGTARAPRLGGCGVVTEASTAHRRLHVLFPTPFATSGWNTVGSVDEALQARGYGSGQLSHLLDGDNSYPTREDGPPLTLHARWRVREPWSIEVQTSLGAKRAAIRAYREADSSYVRADYAGHHGAVLAGYQRGFFRFSAGPAFLRNSWAIEESEVHATYDTLGMVSGWQTGSVRGTNTYREWVTGVVGQVALTFPVSPYVFIELRTQVRRFGERATRATGRFGPVETDHSGYTVSLGLGAAL